MLAMSLYRCRLQAGKLKALNSSRRRVRYFQARIWQAMFVSKPGCSYRGHTHTSGHRKQSLYSFIIFHIPRYGQRAIMSGRLRHIPSRLRDEFSAARHNWHSRIIPKINNFSINLCSRSTVLSVVWP